MTLVLYSLAVLALLVSFIKSRAKTKMALKKAWKSLENILPQLLTILFVIGIALAILTPDQISRFIGGESGWMGVFIALAVGSITLVPGPVAFPLASALLENGAGYMQLAAFISSLTMVGVVTMPMEISYFGKKSTVLRNSLALIFSVFVAVIMGVLM